MRIRLLAVAVVTAGALMATLTGAASADTPTPAPLPEEGVALIVDCEGGGRISLMTRALTKAEREELGRSGAAFAVPALPSGQAGEVGKVESGRIKITKDITVAKPDAEPSALPEDSEDSTVKALPTLPGEARRSGKAATPFTTMSVPEGARYTKVRVTRTPSGDLPAATCVQKAEEK